MGNPGSLGAIARTVMIASIGKTEKARERDSMAVGFIKDRRSRIARVWERPLKEFNRNPINDILSRFQTLRSDFGA